MNYSVNEGPLKGLSCWQIREQRLAPDGTRAAAVPTELEVWDLARAVVAFTGGAEFGGESLAKLIDDCGADCVWWHAKWYLSRINALKEPPAKPTPYFMTCVRADSLAYPTWQIVTEYHAELAEVESRLAAGPDSYAEYLDYLHDDERAEYLRAKIEDPTWEPPEPSAELLAEIFGTDDEFDDSVPF
jgi:hypothetical protein